MRDILKKIHNHFRGIFEIFLFRESGVYRFDPGIRAMLASFLLLALTLPLNYYFNQMAMILMDQGRVETLGRFALSCLIQILTVLGGLYAICRFERKSARFYTLVTIGNWMSLSTIIPFLLLLIIVWAGWGESVVLPASVFFIAFSAYTLACSVLVMKSVLGLTWKRGAFYTLALFLLIMGLQRGILTLAGY